MNKLLNITMPTALLKCGLPLICAVLLVNAAVSADPAPLPLPESSDANTVPAAQESTQNTLPVVSIPSPVPSYIDLGVTMIPLRPIADFLNISVKVHNGIITLAQQGEAGGLTMATVRLNTKAVQVASEGKLATMSLRLPVETRMGNTFVPMRFVADVFHADASFRVPDNAIVLRTSKKIGVLTPNLPPEYQGRNASILTLTNRIGKPMSLLLNGPQKIMLELGRGQKITRRVAPGVYYYKAVCANMRPRSGARRLSSGSRVNWTWGHG